MKDGFSAPQSLLTPAAIHCSPTKRRTISQRIEASLEEKSHLAGGGSSMILFDLKTLSIAIPLCVHRAGVSESVAPLGALAQLCRAVAPIIRVEWPFRPGATVPKGAESGRFRPIAYQLATAVTPSRVGTYETATHAQDGL